MFSDMNRTRPDITAQSGESTEQENLAARESDAAPPAQEQARGDRSLRRQSQHHALTARWARALLEGMADGFLAVDDEAHITYVNSTVEQVLGRGRDELLGRNAWDVFPEALGLSFFWHYHRVMASRTPVQFEAYYPPLDIWLEARLSPLPDGGVAAYVGDVSARKHLEEEHEHLLEREQAARIRAEEAERRARVTFEQAAIGMAHVAPDGRLLRVNDRICAILGRTRDELLTHTFMDITYPDDLEADVANVRRLLSGELTTFSMEKRYVRPDGSLIWGNLTVSLVRDMAGTPEYLISAVEDITERKQLEQALRDSEQHAQAQARELDAILEAMAEGVTRFDRAGHVVWMNAAIAAQLRQVQPQTMPTVPSDEREAQVMWRDLVGLSLPHRRQLLERVLQGEQLTGAQAVDVRARKVGGQELILNLSGTPLRDASEQVIGAVCISRDVTEQRRWEQQRVDILRTVAHDLANPVTAVRMYLQTQQRRLSKGEPPFIPSEALLDNMMHAVMRIERLLGDFKAAISIETDTLRLDKVRYDLADMCRNEAEVQRVVSGREVLVEMPVEPVPVLADVDRIEQVVANLLSNAHKYSLPTHPIWLTLRCVDDYAYVTVRDEGVGIPEVELQHIWEQFHRAAGVEAQDGSSGLGLGLYICRSLVERHGGTMGAESAVGKGSTFWFTLPLAASDE